MPKKVSTILLFLSFFLFPGPYLGKVLAASLQFDPTAISVTTGQTLSAKVNVDTGTSQVTAVDIFILFDQNLLEFQTLTNGTFFPLVSKNTALAGKIYISGLVDDLNKSKTGKGTVASIVFKSKKVGSGNLSFDCTQGSYTDSNILLNDENATDVLQCSTNGKLAFAISSTPQSPTSGYSSAPTTTPIVTAAISPTVSPTSIPGTSPTLGPTLVPTSVPTAIPTITVIPTTKLVQLPRAGIIGPLFNYSTLGIGFILMGGIIRLLL